jgi:homoserine/homoserine lactone efflux protein
VLLAAIAFGLAWVVRNAATLFDILRWVGAGYLIWLGIQAWRHAGAGNEAPALHGHIYFWRGFVVAIFNPKTIAFFTAFLPQFIDPRLPAEPQLALMCSVTVVMAALMDAGWAIAAGLGRSWFMASWRAKLVGRISGLALIGGGLWLSMARRVA